jgi:hypothetical protein
MNAQNPRRYFALGLGVCALAASKPEVGGTNNIAGVLHYAFLSHSEHETIREHVAPARCLLSIRRKMMGACRASFAPQQRSLRV